MSQKTTAFRANKLIVYGTPYGPQFEIGDDGSWEKTQSYTVYFGERGGTDTVTLDGKEVAAEDVPAWFAANAAARRPMSGEITTDSTRYGGVVALRLVSSDLAPEE